jgi:hypothetical protein
MSDDARVVRIKWVAPKRNPLARTAVLPGAGGGGDTH